MLFGDDNVPAHSTKFYKDNSGENSTGNFSVSMSGKPSVGQSKPGLGGRLRSAHLGAAVSRGGESGTSGSHYTSPWLLLPFGTCNQHPLFRQSFPKFHNADFTPALITKKTILPYKTFGPN